jgi:voltage-gated potassium channel
MSLQARSDELRTISDRFDQRIRKAVARRGAFPFLVATTLAAAMGAGAVARLTARDDFHSFGDAMWWALVTLTTVGYGDVVPQSTWGRCIGAFVMALGITFISFLTATVTSIFVSQEEHDREDRRLDREEELRSMLRRIEDHLAAIDRRLAERGSTSSPP